MYICARRGKPLLGTWAHRRGWWQGWEGQRSLPGGFYPRLPQALARKYKEPVQSGGRFSQKVLYIHPKIIA